VTRLNGSQATVSIDDGSERVIDVPPRIHVAIGMRVTIVDTGDGKPIYAWGT
jgi:hypothetical protein